MNTEEDKTASELFAVSPLASATSLDPPKESTASELSAPYLKVSLDLDNVFNQIQIKDNFNYAEISLKKAYEELDFLEKQDLSDEYLMKTFNKTCVQVLNSYFCAPHNKPDCEECIRKIRKFQIDCQMLLLNMRNLYKLYMEESTEENIYIKSYTEINARSNPVIPALLNGASFALAKLKYTKSKKSLKNLGKFINHAKKTDSDLLYKCKILENDIHQADECPYCPILTKVEKCRTDFLNCLEEYSEAKRLREEII